MPESLNARELRDRQLFTGREQELERFRRVFDSRPGEPELLLYHGIGGIGKSWLLNQIASRMNEANIPTVMLYCDRLTLPGSLKNQLRHSIQGYPRTEKDFRNFDRDWKRLEGVGKKIKKLFDKASGGEGGQAAGKAAGTMVSATIETTLDVLLPGPVGGILGKLLGKAGEALAEATVDKIVPSLTKRGLIQDDAEFYANASEYLSVSLASGINALAQRVGRVVLMVDAIEFLRDQDEFWLKNQIIERLDLSRVIPVLAGRRKLDGMIWRDWQGLVHQLEIRPFTPLESQAYLLKRGVQASAGADRLHAMTHGMPLGLAIAAFVYASGASLEPSLGEIKTQVFEQLLRYILERVAEPNRREQLLMSAVPRTITFEVLKLIFSDPAQAQEVYDWLRSLHTTQIRDDGLVFHDVIREILTEYFRQHAPHQVAILNQRLAAWYAERRAGQMPFSSDWQRTILEYLYHFLQVDEDRAIQEAALYFLNAQEFIGRGLIGDLVTLFENYPPTHPRNQAWVDYCRAQLAFSNSRFDDAQGRLRALYLRPDLDLYLRANVVTSLAVLTQYRGQIQESIRLHEEGLKIRRQLDDREGIKRSLTNAGRIYRITRDWKGSLANLTESRRLAEEDKDQLEVGRILLNTGYISMYQGQWVEAEGNYMEALAIARQGGDRYDSSKALMRLGQLRIWEERPTDAMAFLRESIHEYKITGELFGEGFAHNYLGDALTALQQWEEAHRELNEALLLFQSPRINAQDRVGNVHHSFGHFYFAKGEWAAAHAAFGEAARIRRDAKTFYYLPKSLIGRCLVELAQGALDKFEACAQEAENYARQYEDFFQLARLRAAQAHAHLLRDKTWVPVVPLYTEALTYALRFNGYAARWVLRELDVKLRWMTTSGMEGLARQILFSFVEACRAVQLDNRSLDEAERAANNRVPTLIEKGPEILATLTRWLVSWPSK